MKKLILLFCALGMAVSSWAYDFTSGGIYYNISSAKTVAVAYNSSYSGIVTIPDSVTNTATGTKYLVDSIGNDAFYSCSNLTSITIPSSITAIGDNAFNNCTGLKSITIPSSVTFIGSGAFTWCSGFTSVIIPSSVTSIGDNAFNFCNSMHSITIPSSVKSIGDEAFNYCVSLTEIYSYATTPVNLSYSSAVFYSVDTTKCTLHVPTNSLAAYKAANVWKGFKLSADITLSVTNVTASNSKVTVRNGQAVITGTEAGTALSVYNLQGTAIYTGKTSGETESIALPCRGVYIVQLGGKSVKVIY